MEAMNVEQAAEYLGVCAGTVRKLIKSDAIPSMKVSGRVILRKKYLDEWIEQKMQESCKKKGDKPC